MHLSAEELSRPVNVTAQLTATWDGSEHDLSKGVNVAYGVAHHWAKQFPDVTFNVKDIKQPTRAEKEVINPLEANDRGEAFAGLKRRKTTGG